MQNQLPKKLTQIIFSRTKYIRKGVLSAVKKKWNSIKITYKPLGVGRRFSNLLFDTKRLSRYLKLKAVIGITGPTTKTGPRDPTSVKNETRYIRMQYSLSESKIAILYTPASAPDLPRRANNAKCILKILSMT